MGSKKKGSRIAAAQMFAALDTIAAEVAAENLGQYTAAFGGDVHERFVEWRINNPGLEDEHIRAFRDLQRWDQSKHPRVCKAKGQGILGFYDPNFHLAIDGKGGRVKFSDVTLKHWDAWWEQQEEEFKPQVEAHEEKRKTYYEVRSKFDGPTDSMPRVMTEEFNWPAALIPTHCESVSVDHSEDEELALAAV